MTGIPFTKMHGLGNDYVYVDGHEVMIDDVAELARAVSDRHRGIGSDGLVLILPSEQADVTMRMWNADGSESAMCGNALRCVARYVIDRGLASGPELTIETAAGVHAAQVTADGEVRVSLGAPVLERRRIPMLGEPADGRVLGEPLDVDGREVKVSAVSMGNPHLVIEVDDVATAPVHTLGPRLEHDARLPERTNVEFIRVLGRDRLAMRVWERGSGETQACGSGAAASTVAATLLGRVTPPIIVELLGGPLRVDWREGGPVWIEGGASYAFEGVWPVADVPAAPARAE
jgi:diaminopimelate epimerase